MHVMMVALITLCKPSKDSVRLWNAGWQCCHYTNNNLMISFQRQLFYFSTTLSSPTGYLLSMHVIHNRSVVAIGTSEDGEMPDSSGCTHLLPGGNFSILNHSRGDFVLYAPSIKGTWSYT